MSLEARSVAPWELVLPSYRSISGTPFNPFTPQLFPLDPPRALLLAMELDLLQETLGQGKPLPLLLVLPQSHSFFHIEGTLEGTITR